VARGICSAYIHTSCHVVTSHDAGSQSAVSGQQQGKMHVHDGVHYVCTDQFTAPLK